jgi:amino acid transporter
MNQKKVTRRYIREFGIAMGAYLITLIISVSILKNELIQMRQFVILISLAPALPVAFILIALMRALKESDELQQRIQLFATSFSAALTGFITFSYGFLENVGFPKFPTFLVFPMLIAIWGISLGYFSRRYQ